MILITAEYILKARLRCHFKGIVPPKLDLTYVKVVVGKFSSRPGASCFVKIFCKNPLKFLFIKKNISNSEQ